MTQRRQDPPPAWRSGLVVLGVASMWTGCLITDTIATIEGPGGSGAGGSSSRGGSPSKGGGTSTATTSTGCEPESDAAFCARLARTCDEVTSTDNCGAGRTAFCGTCPTPLVCVSNACQAPACTSFDPSATGELIAGLSVSGEQNVPAGVTPSGSTILFQRGVECSSYASLWIADETTPGSRVYQVQAVAPPANMWVTHEEAVTLTADGLTIISPTLDFTAFLSSTRPRLGSVDFGPPSMSDFVNLGVTAPQELWAPVISADGLAFYYVIVNDPSGSVSGIYESVRASTSVPFPPGQLMPPLIQQVGQYVDALSVDRMTMFLEAASPAFNALVLTRSSLEAPFTNPNAPGAPPLLPGLRTRPLANCTVLVGTCSTGGCLGENICFFGTP